MIFSKLGFLYLVRNVSKTYYLTLIQLSTLNCLLGRLDHTLFVWWFRYFDVWRHLWLLNITFLFWFLLKLVNIAIVHYVRWCFKMFDVSVVENFTSWLLHKGSMLFRFSINWSIMNWFKVRLTYLWTWMRIKRILRIVLYLLESLNILHRFLSNHYLLLRPINSLLQILMPILHICKQNLLFWLVLSKNMCFSLTLLFATWRQ